MAETTVIIKAKDKTKKAFGSVGKSLGKMKSSLFNAKSAIAGLVGVAGFGALVVSAGRAADSLAKTSDKLGLSTEALGGLRHAAELTGVSTNTMDMALQRMTRRLSEAAKGTGEAVGALQELGINAKDIAKLSPDKAFQKLSAAMAETSSQGDKVRLAMKLFDSEGVALVNTMALGEKGLQDASAAAEAYGIALNRADASKIERANDAMLRIQTAVKGFATTVAVQLAPFMELIANRLAAVSQNAGGFKDSVVNAMTTVVNAIGILRDAIQGLNIAWSVVKLGAIAAFDGIISGVAVLDNVISGFLDKLPGLDVKPSADLQIWAGASALAVNDAASGLKELLDAERPSIELTAALRRVTEEADALSQKMLENKDKLKFGDDDQAALDAEFEAASAHTDRMLRLIEMEEAASAKQLKLEKVQLKAKFDIAKGITSNLSTLMASSSKKEFEVGKKFAVASALISGYQAVVGAYAAGAKIGGPYLGAAYAVTAGYATKVQIDNIKKQQFGGGGGLSVSGGAGGGVSTGANFNGGAPAEPAAETAQATQAKVTRELFVTVEGDGPHSEGMRTFAKNLAETIKDMGSDVSLVIS